jgi:hypothetical protein
LKRGVLRLVRSDPSRARFDARFFERDARFEPIAEAARAFAELTDWPTAGEIDRALGARAGIRFVIAARRPRRKRGPVDLDSLYDAHIVRGEVPTRERHWHDFLNALVWATFPRAKAALHARQHRALVAWARGGAPRESIVEKLPNARTRELDALALIDEGGVLDCGTNKMIFGHALYEGLVLGTPAMVARAVVLSGQPQHADDLLAARLGEPLAPEHLPRTTLAPIQYFKHD